MRIELNLATRPYVNLGPALKHLRMAMAVLAVVALALAGGLYALHAKADAVRARERVLDERIGAINRERQGYKEMMRQPANEQLLKQAASLNQLFDQKSFSWTLAMEDLERVLPAGVQVTTLEPTPSKTGRITLHLHVIGPRDRAVELVQNFERSRYFLVPRIVSESVETTNGGPNERLEPVSASNRVIFDLLADYNPVTPDARKAEKMPAPADAAPHQTVAAPPAGAKAGGRR